METMTEILLDPVSLVVIAMYAGLVLWEWPSPRRARRADAAKSSAHSGAHSGAPSAFPRPARTEPASVPARPRASWPR